jgi:hypothetical protein
MVITSLVVTSAHSGSRRLGGMTGGKFHRAGFLFRGAKVSLRPHPNRICDAASFETWRHFGQRLNLRPAVRYSKITHSTSVMQTVWYGLWNFSCFYYKNAI